MKSTTHTRHTFLPRTWTSSMTLLALAALSACNQKAMVGDEADSLTGGSGGASPSGVTVGVNDSGASGGMGGSLLPASGGSAGISTNTSTGATSTCAPISTSPGVVNACGHTFAAAFSPNGQFLVTGGDDQTPSASLWRLRDGTALFNPAGTERETTYAAAFSPDSSLVATAGTLTDSSPDVAFVRVWNVATGELLRTLPTNAGWYADSVAFSHDGTLIATGGLKDNVEIWRTSDGARLRSFAVPSTAHNVHFSPDDTLLMGAIVDGTARIWNVQDGSLVRTIPTTSEMADADWSPDGKLIASTTDGNIVKIWDAASGALVQSLSGHSAYISHVAWVDKDRLLSDDWSGVVNLWARSTTDSFALAATWTTGGQALGIAISPDKSVFVTGGAKATATGFAFFPLPAPAS